MAKKNKLYSFEVKEDNIVHHGIVLAPKKKDAKKLVKEVHGKPTSIVKWDIDNPKVIHSESTPREVYENKQDTVTT